MNRWLIPILLLSLALAGCADDETPDEATDDTTDEEVPFYHVPEDIDDSRSVPVGVDPQNYAEEPPCSLPSNTCIKYPFTTEGKTKVQADLTFDLPASDFDLYIMADGAVVDSSTNLNGEAEAITTSVGIGDFEVWVVPWSVVGDNYHLTVAFTA